MAPLNSQTITLKQLAKTIDHSLLTPDLTETEVAAGCELADRYHVASVCVKPCDVKLAARLLKKSDVKVGTVVGFPHGNSTTETKVFEARRAMENGAVELDMVINIGAMRGGKYDDVRDEIRAVVEAARGKAIVKVILENACLSKEEIVKGCQLVEQAGADYVKTSTGFAASGATVEDLKLMRASVSDRVKVKAAHGIRSLDALLAAIDAGASRVGARSTASMLDEFAAKYPDRKG
ncbi:MAG: deoxyribose-phosphate aldolase [Leptolinea sp.]|jgi:deoxyribose-phosphate aldolase|nr:deoxyribose-phosphate aldolase [Leptolinea sp.]